MVSLAIYKLVPKSLLRKIIPVAGRVLGVNDTTHAQDENELRRRLPGTATSISIPRGRGDAQRIRTDRTSRARRRAPAHKGNRRSLGDARAALRARETPSPSGPRVMEHHAVAARTHISLHEDD